jgi:hypothetical protein
MKKIFTLFVLLTSIHIKAQVCQIPVIIHVIHGGQTPGTYPNLAQGQLNSQIQVLNDDYAGVGYNSSTYPINAFTAWATNTFIAAASKDGLGRIKIANTGISFCLATKDSLGNILAEPGIHRVDYNTLPTPTGTNTSKNPANTAYNTTSKLMGFFDTYIKPNTIWNCSKYLNIWVSDANSSIAILGYSTFPPASTLPGLSSFGTASTDGIWVKGRYFGSSTIFPGGTYFSPWDLGRVCTHETGHWLGLTHSSSCPANSDWCDDTPGSNSSVATCTTSYPFGAGTCTTSPSNSPDGGMFMNFMGYSDDCAMYMFTQDQANRMNTAKNNSPYRKFLGLHGLCPTGCALSGEHQLANENTLLIFPNPANEKLQIRSEKNIEAVTVKDVFGKTVFQMENISKNTFEINTGVFAQGIYFAIINGQTGTSVRKFVKE